MSEHDLIWWAWTAVKFVPVLFIMHVAESISDSFDAGVLASLLAVLWLWIGARLIARCLVPEHWEKLR